MDVITTFTVKRSTWVRGRPGYLLMEDGRMCCLGFFVQACGIPPEAMLQKTYPGTLLKLRSQLPPWVIDYGNISEIVHVNDTIRVIDKDDDETREARLKKLFMMHGVEIVFED